jgi:putative component of membrane protein insertase Oxa1/YidC/SpoIIIJ protein YidD
MRLTLAIIKFYQSLLFIKRSLLMSVFGYQSICKHRPTCSQYTLQQVKKNGTITGLWRGFWRIIRCI